MISTNVSSVRRTLRATMGVLVCAAALVLSASAQEPGSAPETAAPAAQKPMPSPPAKAEVTLGGKSVTIDYHSPSMRGRKIFGGLVPYGKPWRTGANPATTLKTEANLKIGTANVPAGTYTLYTLPGENDWKLIINKQTCQWGTEYHQDRDLARVDMKKATLPQPQEKMTISFEGTSGNSTELHIKWENTDVSVPVTAE